MFSDNFFMFMFFVFCLFLLICFVSVVILFVVLFVLVCCIGQSVVEKVCVEYKLDSVCSCMEVLVKVQEEIVSQCDCVNVELVKCVCVLVSVVGVVCVIEVQIVVKQYDLEQLQQ